MRPLSPRKQMAGLLSAGVVMAGVAAAALLFGPKPGAPAEPAPDLPKSAAVNEQEPASVAFSSGPDLNGDGRPDTLSVTGAGVRAIASGGGTLLDFGVPVLPETWLAIQLESTYPVLFVQTAQDEHAAFAFAPGEGVLKLLAWPDGGLRGYGELSADGSLKPPAGDGGHRPAIHLRLDQDHLAYASAAFTPLRAVRPRPSQVLAAAVEAAATRLGEELQLHVSDPALADAFLKQWAGELPPGTARVANADDVDAGAENGHRVPVTVWVSDGMKVAGLEGEASFETAPAGYRIQSLRMAAIPLKVSTRAEALRRLKAARPGLRDAVPANLPFYGTYRFQAGGRQYAVNAATGEVEDE